MTKFYQILHKFVAKQQQSINDKRLLLGRAAICNLTAKTKFYGAQMSEMWASNPLGHSSYLAKEVPPKF